MIMSDMPASYDSWRLASPPEPTYEDYEIMIDNKIEEINTVFVSIGELVRTPWRNFCSEDLAGVIHDIEEQLQELRALYEDMADIEEEQSHCRPYEF